MLYKILLNLKPGDTYGELYFFSGQEEDIIVKANGVCQLIYLLYDDFEKIIKDFEDDNVILIIIYKKKN